MRVAVIGRSGQIATALLATKGMDEAIALGRPTVDLMAPESLLQSLRKVQPDIIVNAAAYTAVDRAESEPDLCYAINRDGAAAIAAVAADLGVPLLHLSTDFVFDGSKLGPYDEEDMPAPLNIYGASKLAGEQAVRAANPEAVIVRLSWVYATQGQNFVRTMLRLAETRHEIAVVDDQFGRPSAADDIATALWALAARMVAAPAPQALYHLGPPDKASWADFAEQIMASSRARGGAWAQVRRISSSQYPVAARRPANAVLDCTRMAQDFAICLPVWRHSCDRIVGEIVTQSLPAETTS